MRIVFYDLETTIPPTHIVEFGCVVVDAETLKEIDSFETLIYSDRITDWSISVNGITPEMVSEAPRMRQAAGKIYDYLHGHIWAGHNIRTFDNPIILRTFDSIGLLPPQFVDTIDTLLLSRERLAGQVESHKLETLAEYYNLGQEDHRSLSDARLALQVYRRINQMI